MNKEEQEYVYIMDYSDCTINRINITNEEDDDVTRILRKYGFNEDECSYMYVNKEIDINIIS